MLATVLAPNPGSVSSRPATAAASRSSIDVTPASCQRARTFLTPSPLTRITSGSPGGSDWSSDSVTPITPVSTNSAISAASPLPIPWTPTNSPFPANSVTGSSSRSTARAPEA